MVQASVGYQCVDCVGQWQRTMQARVIDPTAFPVTKALIAVNVVAFILTRLIGPGVYTVFGVWGPAVAAGQWYRLLTGTFLHAGLMHLALNMLALYAIGRGLEPALGRGRFLMLYLAAALGGSVASVMFHVVPTLSVGASGAIFGLFGGMWVILRRVGADTGGIAGIIVINLLFGLVNGGLDMWAHVGGLVVGCGVAALLGTRRSRR